MKLRRLLASLFVTAACAAAQAASAADLKVGDPAPALSFAKFVKGEPVTSIDKDKVYVVEFWATWCGPCVKAIPHVSELQAKHKDVVFIGANVWEEDESLVEPFVQKMGDKMNYRVAMDDKSKAKEGAMANNWLAAAGQNGIPCSFIVNKGGTVAWIGHPMSMEAVLDQVVAGTFDAAAAKKQAEEETEKAAEIEKTQQAFMQRVVPLIQAKNWSGASAALDDLAKEFPSQAKELRAAKFGVLLSGKQYDAAYEAADQIAKDSNDDAQSLNALAWTIVDSEGIEQRDFDRAEKYAKRAHELEPEDAAIMDTLARVYAEKGDLAKAIELQEKAVSKADGELKAELAKTLDGYKKKSK